MPDETGRPPRQDLIRAVMPGTALRDAGPDGLPTLFGHFSRFNEPTEINSQFEGHFIERIAPGAFRKTFQERRNQIKVLFQHGMDPEIGDKPIAAINELREDPDGAYYEATLFRGLPPLVLDGLRAGQYGASFRFSVMREAWDENPRPSASNPQGLRERTIKEAAVPEFGPVTFPAYAGATSGVRSLTDEFLLRAINQDPDKMRELMDRVAPGHRDAPIIVNTMHPADPATVHAVADAATAGLAMEERATDTLTPESEAPEADDEEQYTATPDEPEAQAPEASRRDGEQDAPSEDDAADPDGLHLTDERRDTSARQPIKLPIKRAPIYGTRRKETSKPWLLGPSRNTKQS